jgi:hypothetical protein
MLINPTGPDTLNSARLSPSKKSYSPARGCFFCFGGLLGYRPTAKSHAHTGRPSRFAWRTIARCIVLHILTLLLLTIAHDCARLLTRRTGGTAGSRAHLD